MKKKLIQVNLTYRCNKSCSYCYAMDLKEDFEKDMSVEDFATLLDWLEKNGLKYFNITGGEPTLHPNIGEMLMLAADKGFKVTVFSNGIFPESFYPYIGYVHSFLINYNSKNTYSPQDYATLHKHLEMLKQKNDMVTFAFNITPEIESCEYVVEGVKKYGIKNVNMDLIIPNCLKNNEYVSCGSFKEHSERINKFLKTFKENDISVKFTRPMPFCLFKNEIRENKGVLHSTCSVGYGIVSINPDLTTFPCLSIFFKGPRIVSFNSFREVMQFYSKAINNLKWKQKIYSECGSCIYLKRKKCQGSCLCHKCAQFDTLIKPEYSLFSQYPLTGIEGFITLIDWAIKQLNKIFGRPSGKFKIYLFNNKQDMLSYSGIHYYPEWVTGFASKNAYYQYQTKIGKRIIHELCHIYITKHKKGEIPLWFEEGFCEYLVYKDEDNSKFRSIMKEKKLIQFDKLFEKGKMSLLKYDSDPVNKNIAYKQSCSMINYLIKKFGTNTVMKLLTGDYKDFRQYFCKLTKQRFENVEEEWLSNIKDLATN